MFAVQPASESFNPHACLWTTNSGCAYRFARTEAASGDDQVIWHVPHGGTPAKWATVAGEMQFPSWGAAMGQWGN